MALRAIRAPAEVVLKVFARRPRALFEYVMWYGLRSHRARNGTRGETWLGPWDTREIIVVRHEGRVVRLVRNTDSMSRYQLRHVS